MPKIIDRDRYRQELLTNCFDLFAEQGYAAVTMRQIAQALGVSTGTLYHYFPSKQELFEQMVEVMAERDLAIAARGLSECQSLAERIEAAFEFLRQQEDYFFRQLLMYIDFYQYQKHTHSSSQSLALKRVCDRLEVTICEVLGLADPSLAQLTINLFDGLLCARLYGSAVDWTAKGKLWSAMVTAYVAANSGGNSIKS